MGWGQEKGWGSSHWGHEGGWPQRRQTGWGARERRREQRDSDKAKDNDDAQDLPLLDADTLSNMAQGKSPQELQQYIENYEGALVVLRTVQREKIDAVDAQERQQREHLERMQALEAKHAEVAMALRETAALREALQQSILKSNKARDKSREAVKVLTKEFTEAQKQNQAMWIELQRHAKRQRSQSKGRRSPSSGSEGSSGGDGGQAADGQPNTPPHADKAKPSPAQRQPHGEDKEAQRKHKASASKTGAEGNMADPTQEGQL